MGANTRARRSGHPEMLIEGVHRARVGAVGRAPGVYPRHSLKTARCAAWSRRAGAEQRAARRLGEWRVGEPT